MNNSSNNTSNNSSSPSSNVLFQNCLNKLIDYLSRRDHSTKELREKLKRKLFDSATIEASIQWAQERGYILAPEELSLRLSQQLIRRGKGRLYIEQYLKKKGLPSKPAIDDDSELSQALEFARQRAKKYVNLDRSTREKIGRQLVSRGFPLNVVRKVIYEKLEDSESNDC